VTRIFWDTNLFVYLFEGGEFAPAVKRIRARMDERGDTLVTSTLTLAEIQVLPLRESVQAAERAAIAIRSAALVVSFDEIAAAHYARIRQDRGIRAPDAIQLACAAGAEVDLFITNDDRLATRTVPGIKFITSLGRAFL